LATTNLARAREANAIPALATIAMTVMMTYMMASRIPHGARCSCLCVPDDVAWTIVR
jgi:hypothetical protein